MKGTEKIIAHIQADAKAKADEILAEAERKCAEIREEYAEKAKEAYAARIRDGVKECEENADNRERLFQMESRKEILALKQKLVADCFSRAKELILSLPEENYFMLLVKLAVSASDNGAGEIILNRKDRERFGDKVALTANAMLKEGKMTISEDVGDFSGGLIVRNGKIEVNSSVELLVDMCREEMSAKAAGVLFG